MVKRTRELLVVADDYGIGPEVSRGVLSLLQNGTITSTVLLANSPFAQDAVHHWQSAGCPGDMGWHPNLTMDEPVARASDVYSLLDSNGRFASVGTLLLRITTGRLHYAHLVDELNAQYQRCHDLIGQPPALVNGHKHIHVLPMIGDALAEVLKRWRVRPYMRRVIEPLSTFSQIPGARLKRLFLTTLGRRASRRQLRNGFPGNDTLAGITDPKWVEDPRFYSRWLERIPGRVVELMVHPGYRDETLIGRDCSATDGQIERRVAELRMLQHPQFVSACANAGFSLQPASESRRMMRNAA